MSKIYIPVGYNCDPAKSLKHFNLRNKSYPFDWCIAHPSSILYQLENNFSTFLSEYKIGKVNHVNWYEDRDGNKFSRVDLHYILDIKSNIVLVHDYYRGITIPDIIEKYTNRYITMVQDIKLAQEIILVYYKPEPTHRFIIEHNELTFRNFGFDVTEKFNSHIEVKDIELNMKKLNSEALIRSINHLDLKNE